MLNSPLVSVVVPTHNRKKSLEALIKSILKSSYKNIQIIIIDDASNDGTYEYILKKYKSKIKNREIIINRNKKNLFTAGTRNAGQKLAKGEYILFIDDDNVIDSKMIAEMVKAFTSEENVGEVGPINYSFRKKSKVFWTKTYRNMFTTKTYHVTEFPRSKSYWESVDVPNSFMVRRDVIVKNKINFDPYYGIMFEESDYAYRIRKAGYKVLVARRAKIYHDIEEYSKRRKTKDYMFHFMSDPRRPYVFARNRITFHARFSNKLQLIGILSFWIWFFNLYYIYKIIFYNGYGYFSFLTRLNLAKRYTMGTLKGFTDLSILK